MVLDVAGIANIVRVAGRIQALLTERRVMLAPGEIADGIRGRNRRALKVEIGVIDRVVFAAHLNPRYRFLLRAITPPSGGVFCWGALWRCVVAEKDISSITILAIQPRANNIETMNAQPSSMDPELVIKRNWSSNWTSMTYGTIGVVIFLVFLFAIGRTAPLVELLFAGTWLLIAIAFLAVAARRNSQQVIWARLNSNGVFDKDDIFHPWDSISEIRYLFGVLYVGSKKNASPALALNPKYLGHEQVALAKKFLMEYAPSELLIKIS